MSPPRIESALHLGLRFEPTPKDVVTYFLPRLIAGEPLHAAIRPFIHHANIYACEPGVLAALFGPTPRTGDRFFFSTCKLQPHVAGKGSRAVRVAGAGSWHSHGTGKDVRNGAGVKIGEVKKLLYKKGDVFTDWLMDEYSSFLEGSCVGGDRQYVLCKMYVSPRAAPNSAARQESDSFFLAPPLPLQEPVDVAAAPKRRPAPQVSEPPSSKKTRVAAVPTPPASVVQPPFPSSSTSTPVATRPVAPPARHMAVQEPAPRHRWPHQPSIQASTAAPAAPCSPATARDQFCSCCGARRRRSC